MNDIFGGYLDKYTYEYLQNTALSQVDDALDKRQGSIIFDAIGPSNYMLALGYVDMKWVLQQAFTATSTGEYLDLKVQERGLLREEATQAIKKGVFVDTADNPAYIAIGTVFKTIDTTGGINYTVTAEVVDETSTPIPGEYQLTCDELGVIGNSYNGPIIPINYINNLKEATMTEVIVAGQDQESDDSVYEKFDLKVNQPPFGGNFSDYKLKTLDYPGIGQVQVYPTWNGGGTVKLSVVDPSNEPVSQTVLDALKLYYDPADINGDYGQGLGIAPIGHVVTCSTSTNKLINVEIDIILQVGYTLNQIQDEINNAISGYINTIRSNWGKEQTVYKTYSATVYRANINAYVLLVPGVETVTLVKLNDAEADVVLTQNKTTQEMAKLGAVVINVVT